jgi:hypothetical protein
MKLNYGYRCFVTEKEYSIMSGLLIQYTISLITIGPTLLYNNNLLLLLYSHGYTDEHV